MERYAEAIEDYGRAIEADPRLAEAYFDRGRLLMALKKTGEAKADFEKTLQLTGNPQLQDQATEILGDLEVRVERARAVRPLVITRRSRRAK